jgi:5-methylcytosine-specific restriction endonuclease McrA
MVLSGTYLKHCVWKRDKGVCAGCGVDCDRIKRAIHYANYRWQEKHDILKQLGFTGWSLHLWEAHHIVPVIRGGADHLDNLLTLCVNCHKIETAKLAAERALERKQCRKLTKPKQQGIVEP